MLPYCAITKPNVGDVLSAVDFEWRQTSPDRKIGLP
jgi:hypothetical protein